MNKLGYYIGKLYLIFLGYKKGLVVQDKRDGSIGTILFLIPFWFGQEYDIAWIDQSGNEWASNHNNLLLL